jgi:hypothetical protein
MIVFINTNHAKYYKLLIERVLYYFVKGINKPKSARLSTKIS